MSIMHNQHIPMLLVGGPGTGKTSTVQLFLDSLDSEVMLVKKINFSSATTPGMLDGVLETELDKRGGKSYGPSSGRHLTLFIDDMNLPECNKWGDQPSLELVRQLISTGGFAFLKKDKRGDLKSIEDVLYIAAMGEPGGKILLFSVFRGKKKNLCCHPSFFCFLLFSFVFYLYLSCLIFFSCYKNCYVTCIQPVETIFLID